ncbi:MAG TPA: nucleoside hydrolase [Prolixibacteraceae bacterium]|nr:nucleoside hydrolase [Prolixibacteraceae bacterium]
MNKIQPCPFQKPVFLDQDGSIDDLVSLIFLMTLSSCRLTGTTLTAANCIPEQAVDSILRIFTLFCRHDLEVALSQAQPVHPFPDKWREKPALVNALEGFRDLVPDRSKISPKEGADFLAEKILQEVDKTIIIATGPASNLSTALEKYPELNEKIEKVYWMAGAFLDSGNVVYPDQDGSAEWNIFWDPQSARQLLHSGLKLVLFPLDACRQVPVDNYLMYYLEKESKGCLSKRVFDIFNINYHAHPKYYMWDVLPAMYLGFPDLFRLSGTSAEIELRGTSVGNIFKTSKGSPIRYASWVDDEAFYTTFLEQLKQF